MKYKRVCKYCGVEFETNYSRKIYCCYEHKERDRHPKKELTKICPICDKEFKTIYTRQIYCSMKCEHKHQKKKHSEYYKNKYKIDKRIREARAKDNGIVDHTVTLSKLIERDNHTCMLCGKLVDETDYTYINNIFIAGNNYPSIDHIQPLSRGGVHQWNNVQLAHRLCNSIKNDK